MKALAFLLIITLFRFSSQQLACSECLDQYNCLYAGCSWSGSACSGTVTPPAAYAGGVYVKNGAATTTGSVSAPYGTINQVLLTTGSKVIYLWNPVPGMLFPI